MSLTDSFLTIRHASDAVLKVLGSRFIGQARPAACESEAEAVIGDIRKQYYDATHSCYAYRTGMGSEVKFRYSDAGEPSGTAGRPIYSQIEGKGVTNIVVVVTRYFGGTKLGSGRLARTYSEVAAKAIEAAGIEEKFVTGRISFLIHHHDYDNVERLIRLYEGQRIFSDFSDEVRLEVEIRLSRIEEFKQALSEATSGRAIIDRKT
jgi:uncharacterized YigZ family protein